MTGREVEGPESVEIAAVEVERWKENYENSYHGNELHKLKMSSVLPTLSYHYISDVYTHAVSISST